MFCTNIVAKDPFLCWTVSCSIYYAQGDVQFKFDWHKHLGWHRHHGPNNLFLYCTVLCSSVQTSAVQRPPNAVQSRKIQLKEDINTKSWFTPALPLPQVQWEFQSTQQFEQSCEDSLRFEPLWVVLNFDASSSSSSGQASHFRQSQLLSDPIQPN